MIKVFVADDHAVVRRGMLQILEEAPDMVSAGEAGTGREVLRAMQEQDCDVLVVDISMPDGSGLEVLKQLQTLRPDLRVLILSMYPEKQYALRGDDVYAMVTSYHTKAPEEAAFEAHRKYIDIQAVVAGDLPPLGAVLGAGEKTVCDECGLEKRDRPVERFRRPHELLPDGETCLLEQGVVCLGPATRSGCVARCPGDHVTEGMGRLGTMGDTDSPQYKIKDAGGSYYTVQVSIGANENSSSASLQPGPGGTYERWIQRDDLMMSGADCSKTMTFVDYQRNRGEEFTSLVGYSAPTVGPGWLPPYAMNNDKMGSLAFRHNGRLNAAFLDGHAGEITCGKQLAEDGHELAEGETWGTVPEGQGLPAGTPYGTYPAHKIFYPFGPATVASSRA